jgi:hypothetical protein
MKKDAFDGYYHLPVRVMERGLLPAKKSKLLLSTHILAKIDQR